MNVILNPSQSDTKKGAIPLTATSDLTGLENTLVKITNTAGVAQFAVPSNVLDAAIYILASGDVAANPSFAEVPDMGENCRVKVSAAVVAGGLLCLDPNNWGQLYTPAGSSGATNVLFVAEEGAAAGGLCKCRKIGMMPKTY
jgi:hypothetical protein